MSNRNTNENNDEISLYIQRAAKKELYDLLLAVFQKKVCLFLTVSENRKPFIIF